MRSKFAALWNLDRSVEVLRCMHETKEWVRVSAAYLGVSDLSYPWTLHIRGLHPVCLKETSDVGAFWQIFSRRVYPVAGSERVIIDAGANIGFFTLWAARRALQARIIAIEPVPESYERLRENVRRNGLEERVSCLNCALAGITETRMVKVGRPRSQGRRVLPYDPNAKDRIAPVFTKTLSQILEEEEVPSVDLLKMDIEGAEYETLLSSPERVLRRIARISLEYHPDVADHTVNELLQHLQQVGFSLKNNVHNSKGFGIALFQNLIGSATDVEAKGEVVTPAVPDKRLSAGHV
jgi:FkbM family methyltransferase